MNLQRLFLLFMGLFAITVSAQDKVFSFSQVQLRNSQQQWGKVQNIDHHQVRFSADQINLSIDKKYQLTIVSKTDLPDNGIIYLCNDERSNPVTVMLIDNSRMFFYNKSKRYLINFDKIKPSAVVADVD